MLILKLLLTWHYISLAIVHTLHILWVTISENMKYLNPINTINRSKLNLFIEQAKFKQTSKYSNKVIVIQVGDKCSLSLVILRVECRILKSGVGA